MTVRFWLLLLKGRWHVVSCCGGGISDVWSGVVTARLVTLPIEFGDVVGDI